jgi:hypothetical protein
MLHLPFHRHRSEVDQSSATKKNWIDQLQNDDGEMVDATWENV